MFTILLQTDELNNNKCDQKTYMNYENQLIIDKLFYSIIKPKYILNKKSRILLFHIFHKFPMTEIGKHVND